MRSRPSRNRDGRLPTDSLSGSIRPVTFIAPYIVMICMAWKRHDDIACDGVLELEDTHAGTCPVALCLSGVAT